MKNLNQFMKHKSNLNCFIFLIICLVLNSCSKHSSTGPEYKKDDIVVITYSASKEGFRSNSHLILYREEAVLIDAQFIPDDANKVVKLIDNNGKTLSAIIITHPHPDHYYGLEVIGRKYPNVKIYGGTETIKQIKNSSRHWVDKNSDIWPSSRFEVIGGEKITIGELELEYRIFADSESVENVVLHIPSQEILFVGDLASNNVHMWLTEGRIGNWLGYLEEIQEMSPVDKVYPGHGPVSDQVIIKQAGQYINNLKSVIQTSNSVEEAVAKMKDMYPDYEMPEILEGSVIGLFENNKIN